MFDHTSLSGRPLACASLETANKLLHVALYKVGDFHFVVCDCYHYVIATEPVRRFKDPMHAVCDMRYVWQNKHEDKSIESEVERLLNILASQVE